MLRPITVLLVLLAAPACNPNGTCVLEDPNEGTYHPSTCMINYGKRACDGTHEVFFQEDSTAGLLRCKLAGFEAIDSRTSHDNEKKLQNGDVVILFRTTKPKP